MHSAASRQTPVRMAMLGLAAWLCLAASPARATAWVVCDYEVQSVRIDGAKRQLTVRLLKARSRNPADCPEASGEMTFTPETADYQSELPRKQWPAPGRRAVLRYRHLDGICKDAGPCRIRHHSVLAAP